MPISKIQANSVADNSLTTDQFASTAIHGNRNLIINGAMQVAQRGTSSTGVSSLGYYTVDRFKTAYNGTPEELRVTHAQSTDAPTGFSSSFKLTITTAETTLASDERVRFQQRIEGQNLQHLKYGTSNAEYITFSFYVKSNVTGTYGVHLDNSDSSRSVCSAYTINAADTWEKKTISFAGDTTGSFGNNSGRSLDVNWVLAAGTNFTSGTFATSWESDTDANNAPSGQVNLIGTVSNYFQTTGVQLEVGEQATPFEHRSYGDELQRCQRYYEKSLVLHYYQLPTSSGAQVQRQHNRYQVQKRASATLTQTKDSGSSATTVTNVGGNLDGILHAFGGNDGEIIYFYWTADAEL
jgi:hypothetical protein